MHAHRATSLSEADLQRLIAAKVLPAGTHTAPKRQDHPGEFASIREAAAPSPAERFAGLPAAVQARLLDRANLPGGAPHQWLDTDHAALDSREGCAAPADREAQAIHTAFDITVEPWALPHMADRPHDGPPRGPFRDTEADATIAAPLSWYGRTAHPATPMADAQDVRRLRGTQAPGAVPRVAPGFFPTGALPAHRQPPHETELPTEQGASPGEEPLFEVVAGILRDLDAHLRAIPWRWVAAGALVFVAAIAGSALAPWGFALPVLEQPAAVDAATTGGAR